MKFEKIVDGVTEYLSDKIYPTMVDWQKIVAADVIARAIRWAEAYLNNPDSKSFLRALGYVDGDNNVDVQGITSALKKTYSRKRRQVETQNSPYAGTCIFRGRR